MVENLITALTWIFKKIYIIISNFVYSLILKIWFKKDGDKTLRLDYKLDKNSLVMDVGGYLGDWSNLIYNKYKCKIFIFEPVKAYFKKISTKFCHISKIKVFNFGLGVKNEEKYITVMDGSSSFYKKNNEFIKELCEIVNIKEFILKRRLKNIDLIKVNIEGGEFDLLENMIKRKLISKFSNLQIQFHRFIPSAKNRRKKIHRQLLKTHFLTYNYPFVWENWQKRGYL